MSTKAQRDVASSVVAQLIPAARKGLDSGASSAEVFDEIASAFEGSSVEYAAGVAAAAVLYLVDVVGAS